jgi:CheY-like chemotaxis protein
MGHQLSVTSVEGQGTTMAIRLGEAPRSTRRNTPLGMVAIADPADAERMRLDSTAPTILVVDDDPDARLLLGQLIEDAGCRVVQAASGVEALRMARELLPAMIFLDLRLPKISGFDVFRILQTDDLLKNTPVVIASVVGSESRSVLMGAAAVLDKPLSKEQVIDVIHRYLPSTAR